MIKIEWRLRAVTRYVLTRYESDDRPAVGGLQHGTAVMNGGEFADLNLALDIGKAMAAKDAAAVREQPGETSVSFDSVHLPFPKVRAKFVCNELRAFRDAVWADDRDGGTVRLGAVYKGGASDGGNAAIENRIFGQATPSAYAEMTIANPEAYARFEKGREYYVDFIPCPVDGEAMLIDVD